MPAPGQRANDHPFMRVEVIEHHPDDVPQPPGHPVSLDR